MNRALAMNHLRHCLCLLLLASSFSVFAQPLPQGPVVTLGNVAGNAGATLNLPIDIDGEFAAVQFELKLDNPDLALTGFSSSSLPAGFVLDFAILGDDHLRVVAYETSCPAPLPGPEKDPGDRSQNTPLALINAQLGQVSIRIADDAAPGLVNVTLTEIIAADDSAALLAAGVVDGQIEILDASVGPPGVIRDIPTLPVYGLMALAALLLVVGLISLQRRGINVLVVLATTSLVLAAHQPGLAQAAEPNATLPEIAAVILGRQAPNGAEDCNEDGLVDVRDLICARNEACSPDTNQAPVIAPIANQTLTVGAPFSYAVQASDPEGDALSFDLPAAPPGMGISSSGLITWTPGPADLGAHPVTVTVADPEGLSDTESFTATVFEASSTSLKLSAPGNFTVVAGEALQFQLYAASSNPAATLSFSKQAGPDTLQVDPGNGQVSWLTTLADLGSHPVRVVVEDQDRNIDEQAFTVEVTRPAGPTTLPNRAPVLASIADQAVSAGESLVLPTTASDPEGDSLAFTLLAAPDGMTIDNAGVIRFSAANEQAGDNTVTVKVSDPADLSDTGSFNLSVIARNEAPLALDDAWDVTKGSTLSVSAPGTLANDSDPDDDILAAELVTGPGNGTLVLNTDGSFDYTPDIPVGTLAVTQKLRFETSSGPIQPPLIMDMDGNGVPDIIYHTFSELGAVRGDTGETLFKIGLDRTLWYDKAIADIDLDGKPEIVLIGMENGRSSTQLGKKLIALEHDGQLKWLSEVLPDRYFRNDQLVGDGDGTFNEAKVSIADIDQDGTPEIIVGHGRGGAFFGVGYSVFDHQGMLLDTVQAEGIKSTGQNAQLEIVDLDLDGDLEIVAGSVAFSHRGEVLWSRNDIRFNGLGYHTPIAVNLDNDPFPELVRRTETGFGARANTILAWNHDGTDLWVSEDVPYAVGLDAPLVIADVDSDGQADILTTSSSLSSLTAVNGADGSILWTYVVTGETRASSATVLDLDRDGFNEVIWPYGRNPARLLILDGRDGTLKSEEELFSSANFDPSIPIFADVDGDGAAELVFIGHGSFAPTAPAFFVYESVNDDWPPMRGLWNQWNYHVTNINADGTVPQFEQPHWLLPGLNQNRVNERMPEERTEDFDQFSYRATDGELSDQATVYLRVVQNSNPPQFLSTPDNTATVGFEYLYAPRVTDPDPGETFGFILTGGPAGMTIDAVTGLLRWTPTSTGTHNVSVVVTDAGGLSAAQSWVLVVGEPVEVPDVLGLTRTEAGITLEDVNLTTGRLTERFDSTFPAGQVVAQNPPAGAVAEFGAAIDLILSLGPGPDDTDDDGDGFSDNDGDCDDTDSAVYPGAPDSEGDAVDQNCDGVDGELDLERIVLEPANSTVLSNRRISYSAMGIRADGSAISLDGLGVWASDDTSVAVLQEPGQVRTLAAGNATVSLSYQGITGQAGVAVLNGVSTDTIPPRAEITAPLPATEVTAPLEITGTAADGNLLRWELGLIAGSEGEAVMLATGTSAVNDGVLGELDPTTLLNGLYTLELNVFDRGGNLSTARVSVQLTEQLKVGNFSLTYEDLNINIAGLPITVQRNYDSRDKRRGDFGIGWTLGLRSAEVRANRLLGTGWESLKSGNSFQLDETDQHLLSVTLPGGEVETFELKVSPGNSFLLPFSFLTASLEPVGETRGQLELLDNPFLLVIDAQPGEVQLLDDATLDVFDPQRFRYTTPEGLEFILNRSTGLEEFADSSGNRLTFTDQAITHSNGTQVSFERDGLNRITRLTDPEGNQQTYRYDSAGNLAAHTDAEGNATRFRYDINHGLLEVMDPLGNRAVRNEYDDDGRLTAMVDAAGNRVEFTRDIDGREEIIRDTRGNIQRAVYDDKGNVLLRERTVTIDGLPVVAAEVFEYDARGNEIVKIDADGVRTEMTWDADDNLLSTVVDPGGLNITSSSSWDDEGNRLTATDPLGRVTRYRYDSSNRILSITDPLGNVEQFTYTTGGRIATRTDARGTVTSYSYSPRGALLREDIVDASGDLLSRKTFSFDDNQLKTSESVYRMIDGVLTPLTTTFAYDANHRLIETTDPLGNTSRREYDAAGQVVALVDALGRRTVFEYSVRGLRTATLYADGSRTSQTYDGAGNMTSRTDEAGRVTEYLYDELDRQVAIIHPDNEREDEVLSAGGRLLATIDALGNRFEYEYDAAGRLVRTVMPEVVDARSGNPVVPVMENVLDAAGNTLSSTDANGHTTTFSYDALNRLVRTEFADGSSTSRSYDAAGQLVSRTDELGRTTLQSWDGAGRLLSVTQPAPVADTPQPVTRYSWDMTGNRVTQTDALGRTTRFYYDALGRQVGKALPGGQFASASYDAVGNVIAQTDFNGDVVSTTYDLRDRVIRVELPGGEEQSFSYTVNGLRRTATTATGTQTYAYDNRNRVVGITQADGSQLTYTFDAQGNLTSTSTPAQTINYAYDALNRPVQVASQEGISTYGYDPVGNQVLIDRPSAAVTENRFDERNRVVSVRHTDSLGILLASYDNSYLANGLRESVTEADGSRETYGYDALNRLVSEVRTGTAPRAVNYQYDAVGNRTLVNRDGNIQNYSYDQNGRLLSAGPVSYSFDANGNRTATTAGNSTTLMEWNVQNQLVGIIDSSGQSSFSYDVDGNRITADTAAGSSRYVVDPQSLSGYAQVTETRDNNNVLLASYTYGTDLIAAEDGSTRFFHSDAHGNTRLLTDELTLPTDRYVYDGYGRLEDRTGGSENAYLYAGEQFEEAADAYYLRARYYDPDTGVFLSRDPFTGTMDQPLSQQPYLYASADPINNLDPTGQFSVMELAQNISLIGQQIAIRVQPVCSALARAQVVETIALVGNLAWALGNRNEVGAATNVKMPAGAEPYDIAQWSFTSKPPRGAEIKVGFLKGEDSDNSKNSKAPDFAAAAEVADGQLVKFSSSITAELPVDLYKIYVCGTIPLATVSAKLEATIEQGISTAGTYTGVAGGRVGIRGEIKQKLMISTGAVEMSRTLYTVRGGGSNPGLFPGDG